MLGPAADAVARKRIGSVLRQAEHALAENVAEDFRSAGADAAPSSEEGIKFLLLPNCVTPMKTSLPLPKSN